MEKEIQSRSWFLTVSIDKLPLEVKDLSPADVLKFLQGQWLNGGKSRVFAGSYCISEKGYKHCHIVCESKTAQRTSSLAKAFPNCHREITRGCKKDVIEYVKKIGAFVEKGEKVLEVLMNEDEVVGCQGKRTDIDDLAELIKAGLTPRQIYKEDLTLVEKDTLIRKMYFQYRYENTPSIREIEVVWHVGDSGTGKSYSHVLLEELVGSDNIYFSSNTENGWLDGYCGEPILYIDEFKGNIKFGELLTLLDVYKTNIHSRYANVYSLWNTVHITSVFAPEQLYKNTFTETDSLKQLLRRITKYVYHYKEEGEYKTFELDGKDYKNIYDLKLKSPCKAYKEIEYASGIAFNNIKLPI